MKNASKNLIKHFTAFVAISFLFISSSTIAINKINNIQPSDEEAELQITYRPRFDLPLVPTIQAADFPVLSAQGVIAVDVITGNVLYEKNADSPLLPASTTKIMTALVAMGYYNTEDVVTVGNFWVQGQKMRLYEGEQMTVGNLIKGLLIYSANDAAEVLARNYPNGRDGFINVMNLKARQLGLHNTTFKNPSGLDEEGHVSTAADMVKLASYAMARPWFREIVSTKEETVTSVDGLGVHKLTNINALLGETEGVVGIKTGWTEAARENLISYVIRDGKPVIIALLGSQDRFGETEELINWIYTNYKWEPFMEPVYFDVSADELAS